MAAAMASDGASPRRRRRDQAKFYSCQKTLRSGHKLSMSKCKGHKNPNGEVTHSSFVDPEDEIFVNVKMTEFKRPKSGFVTENESPSVKLKYKKKTFNRILNSKKKVAYTKGCVNPQTLYIKPNRI